MTYRLVAGLATAIPDLLLVGAVSAVLFLAAAVIAHRKAPHIQLPLFAGLCVVVLCISFLLAAASTAHLKGSPTGPIERQAQISFWVCGQQLALRDPSRWLSNKLGTARWHEHNDDIMHYQGIPTNLEEEVSVSAFMQAVKGQISPFTLVVPLNEQWPLADRSTNAAVERFIAVQRDGKYASMVNGQTCNNAPAEVQLFAVTDHSQFKILDPPHYIVSTKRAADECLVVEFDVPKAATAYRCTERGRP